jgi:hypothetical protein
MHEPREEIGHKSVLELRGRIKILQVRMEELKRNGNDVEVLELLNDRLLQIG